MKEGRNINMRLESLGERSFRIDISEAANVLGDVLFGFSCGITPNFDTDILELDFGVRCMTEEKMVLAECVYNFRFEVSDLSLCVKEDDNTFDIGVIAPHVFSVAIGTMRGVLAEKTAGTELAKYPLPMVKPMEVAEMLLIKRND